MKVVLTIAGSDSGGGAGVQGDLKTFHNFGCFGVSAVTAITAQNTRAVSGVFPASPEIVEAQIRAVASDFKIEAAKTGMLHSTEIIRAVIKCREEFLKCPLVVDPVMSSTSGFDLLQSDAMPALFDLFRLASLITPNINEAAAILRREIATEREMEFAAEELHREFGAAVLLKGGHLQTDGVFSELCIDMHYDGRFIEKFSAPRIKSRNTHGTGCALSAGITAGLAKGLDMLSAIRNAKEFVTEAIQSAPGLGSGSGPLGGKHART